jgi:hypothetical protein
MIFGHVAKVFFRFVPKNFPYISAIDNRSGGGHDLSQLGYISVKMTLFYQ